MNVVGSIESLWDYRIILRESQNNIPHYTNCFKTIFKHKAIKPDSIKLSTWQQLRFLAQNIQIISEIKTRKWLEKFACLTSSPIVKMETNVWEYILKKFAWSENVTTGDVTKGIQDHAKSSGLEASVGLVQTVGTVTDSQGGRSEQENWFPGGYYWKVVKASCRSK